jgi:arylsulfatase
MVAPWAVRDSRPNLILITIDALRTDCVGAYGSKAGLTPNLDAFAQQASRYEEAYTNSPWTLPSFGAMFTSLLPSECGLKAPLQKSFGWYARDAALPPGVPLLSERLHSVGYATAAELTNPFLGPERGWSRGFDSFRNEGGKRETPPLLPPAEEITRRSREWLRLNRRRPFFFWVHYLDTHVPYLAPTPAPLERTHYPKRWSANRSYWESWIQGSDPATREQYTRFFRLMYGEEVRYTDQWVGELLRGIKSMGLWDSSLIVITADHGEGLLEHGAVDHGDSLHQEVLSVPLLVKWPKGTAADKRVGQQVALADVGATLLQFARWPGADGLELPPLPRRNAAKGQEVYSEALLYGDEQTALTTPDHRVIYHPYAAAPEDAFEVYDRRRDPKELHNLASEGTAPDLRARLKHLTQLAQGAAEKWWAITGWGAWETTVPERSQRELRSMGYVGR